MKRNEEEPMSEINIVPFVDIVLVILIIFMVTAPIVMKSSFKINLPKGSTGEATGRKAFQLHILDTGVVMYGDRAVNLMDIGDLANVYQKENPGEKIIISADESVPHGKVVEVMDVIRKSGLTRIGISVKK